MPWLEWLSLFVRWFHVIAGVAWIGASFYFIWLDNNLKTPPDWKKDKGIKGDLWAIHGGGFYEVAKYSYGPKTMPETLHWFKWEAYSTWLSGMLLLSLVYYAGASAYLIDPNVMVLTPTQAIAIGVAMILGGLAVYEMACRSPLGRYPVAFAISLLIFVGVYTWGATELFSGRGAYLHVGALIGTIMVGNVFFNIMPNQRKMVAAVSQNQPIDPAWGAQAKLRSVHNNYFTLPLLFIMISPHYPITYQHPQNWLVLLLIGIIAAWIRHFFNLKHVGKVRPMILVSAALAMIMLVGWITWSQQQANELAQASSADMNLNNEQQVVFNLIQTHCVGCHSASPSDEVFKAAPLGLMLDTWAQIESKDALIYQRVVQTQDMPLLNKKGITTQERERIGNWYEKRHQ